MKCDKALNDYYNMTMIYHRPATNEINKYYCETLISCLEFIKVYDLNDLNIDYGYKLIKELKASENRSNDTINKMIRYLKRVMIHFEINNNFLKLKLLPLNTKSFKRLYHDDLKLLIDYVMNLPKTKNRIVYQTMILLLLDSGMRISELINIKKCNIDFSSNPMMIYLEETKTSKPRYAPFSEFSSDLIRELMKSHDEQYLFWNLKHDKPFTKNCARSFYRYTKDKLGLERLHSHMLRKTFASLLVENGMSIEMLQNLIGHSRITTTMIYIQYKETKALKEYGKFNNWGMN